MSKLLRLKTGVLKKTLILIPAGLLFLTVLGAPSPAGAEVLDLKACLDRALENSLAVKAARADVSVAEYRLKESKAAYYPVFATSYSYTRLDETPTATFSGQDFQIGTADNFSWEVTLTQPLFMGYRILTGERLSRLGLENARLSVDLARLDLALAVKQAYFDVLLAQKQTLVADQAIRQLEAQVDVAENFFEVGMIPKNDLLQVEVELANAVQNKVLAENNVSLAKARLNTILRRGIETPLEIKDVQEAAVKEPRLEPSLKIALKERAEMKQALVGSYKRTGDTAVVNGSEADNDPVDASVTLSLNWTIWDWNARGHRVGARKSEVVKARHVLNQVKDGVVLEVKQALLNLASTKRNIEVNRKAIEQAEESLRMSQERYQEQVTTSTEVLDAQTRLSQAQVSYYAALYGYYLAQAELRRAMGRM